MSILILQQMNPILIAAAVIPAVVILVYVYKQDRTEREPLGLILSLILMGVFSTFLAQLTERFGVGILDTIIGRPDSRLYKILLYFVVVGGSEELFKFLLLRRRTWNHPDFNFSYDGIVYAVSVSLGFALWENILYVYNYGFQVALLRAVTAVPGHACFGVFMGVWYSMARLAASRGDAYKAQALRRMAFLGPAFIHGLYDYIASSTDQRATGLFIIFIVVLMLYALIKVKAQSRNDTPV